MEATTPGGDEHTYDAAQPTKSATRAFRLRGSRAELITDAKRSGYQSRRHRQRWYTILQLSRIPTTILSALAYFWWDNLFLAIVFFVLAVPMPAVASIFAFETTEKKDKRTRNTYKPAIARQMRAAQLAEHRRDAELSAGGPDEEKKDTPVVIEHEEHPEK